MLGACKINCVWKLYELCVCVCKYMQTRQVIDNEGVNATGFVIGCVYMFALDNLSPNL